MGNIIQNKRTQGHSIWLIPSAPQHQSLQNIIEILAKKFNTPQFAPHVTLLGQLPQEADWIKIQLENLFTTTQVFQLDIRQLSMLDRYFRSMILTIAPNAHLDDYYQRAIHAFQVSAGEPYVPHVSLLYGDIDLEQKKQALEDVVIPAPLSIRIEEVVLMQTEGKPERWREIARYTLNPALSRLT